MELEIGGLKVTFTEDANLAGVVSLIESDEFGQTDPLGYATCVLRFDGILARSIL